MVANGELREKTGIEPVLTIAARIVHNYINCCLSPVWMCDPALIIYIAL
jgi:hypothetical protein